MCVCVCVCVCARVCVCVLVCLRACALVCLRARACARVNACLRMCVQRPRPGLSGAALRAGGVALALACDLACGCASLRPHPQTLAAGAQARRWAVIRTEQGQKQGKGQGGRRSRVTCPPPARQHIRVGARAARLVTCPPLATCLVTCQSLVTESRDLPASSAEACTRLSSCRPCRDLPAQHDLSRDLPALATCHVTCLPLVTESRDLPATCAAAYTRRSSCRPPAPPPPRPWARSGRRAPPRSSSPSWARSARRVAAIERTQAVPARGLAGGRLTGRMRRSLPG